MRTLRVSVFCSAGAIAVALLGAYLNAAESQPGAASAPDLQQRVRALEEKVAQLEKKLSQIPPGYLPTVPPAARAPNGTPLVPTVPQLPPGIPPHSVPREFNGQTYYIVPLAKEPTAN
jgi:hypothetical protein